MEIGHKIKKIRELRNLKQESLANALNVSQKTISKIEHGELKVSDEKLAQIAKAMDVSKEDILNFEEKYSYFNYGTHNGDTAYLINNENNEEVKDLTESIKILSQKLDSMLSKIDFNRK